MKNDDDRAALKLISAELKVIIVPDVIMQWKFVVVEIWVSL